MRKKERNVVLAQFVPLFFFTACQTTPWCPFLIYLFTTYNINCCWSCPDQECSLTRLLRHSAGTANIMCQSCPAPLSTSLSLMFNNMILNNMNLQILF